MAEINVLVLREIMLKNKNNFEIISTFFLCQAENFSEHPRIKLTRIKQEAPMAQFGVLSQTIWCDKWKAPGSRDLPAGHYLQRHD